MNDVSLKDLLVRAASIQRTNYKDDKRLIGKLIHGAIRNLASVPTELWSIDVFHESHTTDRCELMSCVDSLLYALSLLSIQSLDVDSLCELVDTRQDVIRLLHQSHQDLAALSHSTKPIAVLDMDGVLFPYPELFDEFCTRQEIAMLTPAEQKDLYRRSGVKGTAISIPFAKELVDLIRSSGFSVVVLSSRPVSLYPEVYKQSLEFLQKNAIVPDLLAFKDSKYQAAELESLWPKVALFIDDEERHLAQVRRAHPNVHCIHAHNDGSGSYMSLVLSHVKDFIDDARRKDIEDRDKSQT